MKKVTLTFTQIVEKLNLTPWLSNGPHLEVCPYTEVDNEDKKPPESGLYESYDEPVELKGVFKILPRLSAEVINDLECESIADEMCSIRARTLGLFTEWSVTELGEVNPVVEVDPQSATIVIFTNKSAEVILGKILECKSTILKYYKSNIRGIEAKIKTEDIEEGISSSDPDQILSETTRTILKNRVLFPNTTKEAVDLLAKIFKVSEERASEILVSFMKKEVETLNQDYNEIISKIAG